MSEFPFVSVIIPCFNEEPFIENLITDLLKQDYPKDRIEILFIDGSSTDQTKTLIEKYLSIGTIKIIDNHKKIVPVAMNIGIRAAIGEIILRMDAHASYPIHYISKLVNWLQKLNADNVGGIWITKPSQSTKASHAIAIALSNPLGVGNALFRLGIKKPIEADTVPFGCYPRSIFNKIGYYDERLIRNQDIELNKRLKAKGGKIFLVPDVSCIYYSRSTFFKLSENNFRNGEWVILTAYYTKSLSSLSLRHFIPLIFTGYILSIPFLILIPKLVLIPLAIYFILIICVSIKVSIKSSTSPFLLSWAFLVLHISYGAGSFYGLLRLLTRNNLK